MSRATGATGLTTADGRVENVRRQQIVVDGLVTSYLDAGSQGAAPVVLLHDGAWGGSAEASWSGVIPVLAGHYRVIAPDMYGYGSSSKMVQLDVAPYEFRLRQVAALLHTLAIDAPIHLVGNSFGGAMALRAVTLPWFAWRVRSAVSIAGTGGPYRTREALTALSHFDGSSADMQRIVRRLTGAFPGIGRHVERRMEDASSPGHYRSVAAAGLATPFESTKGDDDYPQSLHQVRTPLALISGRQDDLVEQGWAQRIAEHAPSCQVHEIDARHSPNISHPESTAELILEILRDLELAAPAPDGRTSLSR